MLRQTMALNSVSDLHRKGQRGRDSAAGRYLSHWPRPRVALINTDLLVPCPLQVRQRKKQIRHDCFCQAANIFRSCFLSSSLLSSSSCCNERVGLRFEAWETGSRASALHLSSFWAHLFTRDQDPKIRTHPRRAPWEGLGSRLQGMRFEECAFYVFGAAASIPTLKMMTFRPSGF